MRDEILGGATCRERPRLPIDPAVLIPSRRVNRARTHEPTQSNSAYLRLRIGELSSVDPVPDVAVAPIHRAVQDAANLAELVDR
jgi:hypothetical protein